MHFWRRDSIAQQYLQHNHRMPSVNEHWNEEQFVWNFPSNERPIEDKLHVQLLMPYLLLLLNAAVLVVVVARDRLDEDREVNDAKKLFVMATNEEKNMIDDW